MVRVCGSYAGGFNHGDCLTAQFSHPFAICVDPIRPLNFYVGDSSSIRYVDTGTGRVSLIAGDKKQGSVDGACAVAAFKVIYGLVCVRGGDRLFAADYQNHKIRSVDLETQTVTTVAGNGKRHSKDGGGQKCSIIQPRKLAFDRSRSIKPESVLYITSGHGIRRFEIDAAEMTTCEWRGSTELDPWAIDATPSGHLIVSCLNANTIYSFDPRTCEHAVLAGPEVKSGSACYANGSGSNARFDRPIALVVVEHERCAYICDVSNHRIRHITLPASLFY